LPSRTVKAGRGRNDGDGDRFVVIEQQRQRRAAGAEPVAAGRPRRRVHLASEDAQPLDVVEEPCVPQGSLLTRGTPVVCPAALLVDPGTAHPWMAYLSASKEHQCPT